MRTLLLIMTWLPLGAFASTPYDEARQALRESLPATGVLHVVYGADDLVGGSELWVDFSSSAIVSITGTAVVLRTADGRYMQGTGAHARTGAPGQWEPESPDTVQMLAGAHHPASQAVILLAEFDRVTQVRPTGNGWLVVWGAPSYKVWRASDTGPVETEGASEFRYEVSASGRIESWQLVHTFPESRIGSDYPHDYESASEIHGVLVPRYLDPARQGRRPPTPEIMKLMTVELLESAPAGLFTPEGALRRAADAARPMVQAYRESFTWHDSTDERGGAERPLLDPTRTGGTASWSAALLAGGILVLAIGVFAWWRSRR